MAESARILRLSRDRERKREDAERERKRIEKETRKAETTVAGTSDGGAARPAMGAKFQANFDAVEEQLKSATVGLVTLDEMRSAQQNVVELREAQIAAGKASSASARGGRGDGSDAGDDPQKSVRRNVLSFGDDGDDDEEADALPIEKPKKRRLGMDPSVDTSFLPDRDREREQERQREMLRREWRRDQDSQKNEEITVAYAYYDGSQHRRAARVKRGCTIGQFIAVAIEMFKKEFSELRTASVEQMMLIKEDLIIPHHYTFQDFIVTRASGKTGPLWEWDAIGEVVVTRDVAQGEAHPAKVVMRQWYEKNKHIYPASRWETFVPGKEYKRTIDDDLTTI